VKAVADFYAKVMGFKVSDWIEDWFVFMRCNADHHTVNFIKGDNIEMHHMAFELKDMSHMQNACEMFAQRKIRILWGPLRHGPGHNVATYQPVIPDRRTLLPRRYSGSGGSPQIVESCAVQVIGPLRRAAVPWPRIEIAELLVLI